MTEIPEHLLKRSRERRAALGLGGDDAGSDSGDSKPAATTPATTAASQAPAAASGPVGRSQAPEPAAPPPPKPEHPTVVAHRTRRRMPYWAMAAVSLLPIWFFMYARALTQEAEAAEGPIGLGAEIYSQCASCHGGAGGGVSGLGYAFTDGNAQETFPHIEDQLRYVYYGTGEYNIAGVTIYGNPDREGGPHITGGQGNMPGFGAGVGGTLTDYQLLSVVCHERFTLGGAATDGEWADEYDTWCAEGAPAFTGLQGGEFDLREAENFLEGIIPIGMEPAPGSPPGGE